MGVKGVFVTGEAVWSFERGVWWKSGDYGCENEVHYPNARELKTERAIRRGRGFGKALIMDAKRRSGGHWSKGYFLVGCFFGSLYKTKGRRPYGLRLTAKNKKKKKRPNGRKPKR